MKQRGKTAKRKQNSNEKEGENKEVTNNGIETLQCYHQLLRLVFLTLLVLDLLLHILDGVAGLDIKSDGLASEGLDEDLHRSM